MMKFKPNQTRTYDREGFKKRAACLCFRSEQEDEVLLVSSSRYPDQWIVPGGGMEPEEEPGGAAVREVYEEAGVRGKLGRLLGIFENQDRKHRTYVYVLTVTEILEDWEDSVNIDFCPFDVNLWFLSHHLTGGYVSHPLNCFLIHSIVGI
ncbi:diphosphoinositol polyphosphate phosphohydrolase 2 isoform X5 [Molossus molossus]|uniref:diphosphoinositol polyphosphate phosphohydrolase 2 isoform X5 n=1 Tax=Molossus molossus TaxID=27622 RepID=UPI0017469C2C|nr:diphosphoinositol polyphosphate phosphohydrolase 2 isoform X5 [Molossus molossus]